MKKLFLFIGLILLSCGNDELLTADAKGNAPSKDIILTPTVEGTINEQLASMVVTQSAAKPERIKWTVDEETIYGVVILDENNTWLLQTGTSGKDGFYIGNYIINKPVDDGNIHIVKGQQYYLYFRLQDIKVPFTITGKI